MARRAQVSTEGNNNTDRSAKSGPSRRRRCPICKKPSVQKFRPFCSARCAEIDLGRWIGGNYRIPETAANALNSEDDERDVEG
jgi:endogenous inhibitor of DNA gyrase (YacG/DUF329 family)